MPEIVSGPATTSKRSTTGGRILIGATIVLLLNYVFNEVMDESGLHVAIVNGVLPLAQTQNLSAVALFRYEAGERADAAMKDDDRLIRSEVLQHQDDENRYVFISVHRNELPSLSAAVAAASIQQLSTPELFRTVFPERARWRQHNPTREEGMHSQVHHISSHTCCV